ncbi:MAG TPA: flagellar hook-length control protein FliK [Rhodoferax sp.]
MTIESTRAHEGAKTAAAGAHRAGAKSGHSGAAGVSADQGFASVMGLMAAAEDSGDVSDAPLTSSAVLPGSDVASVASDAVVPSLSVIVPGMGALLPLKDVVEKPDKNTPLAADDQGLIAINYVAFSALSVATPTSGKASANQAADRRPPDKVDAALATLPGTGLSVNGHDATSDVTSLLKDRLSNMNSMPVAAPLASAEVPVATTPPEALTAIAQASGKAPVIQAADKRQAPDKVDAALATLSGAEVSVKGHDAAPDVATLLNNRLANASSGISQLQAELREVRTQQLIPVSAAVPDASRMAAVLASINGTPNPPERTLGKLQSTATGAGMEGLLGTALADKLGINPTYEVAPATAVVADTQVAETVSYWATHGVQSAELTLDGLGNEPVKVRISVDGDQTQVDFRSNQPEVRQALESASAQLKTMLSSEGLQLTGMSIGTSGRGQTPGEGEQPKQSPRQTARVSLEPVVATTARVANRSVGQALDLYV